MPHKEWHSNCKSKRLKLEPSLGNNCKALNFQLTKDAKKNIVFLSLLIMLT